MKLFCIKVKPVVHLDVKSANVLLDAYLRAKVADLGLAKVLQKQKLGQITPTTSEDDLDKGDLISERGEIYL